MENNFIETFREYLQDVSEMDALKVVVESKASIINETTKVVTRMQADGVKINKEITEYIRDMAKAEEFKRYMDLMKKVSVLEMRILITCGSPRNLERVLKAIDDELEKDNKSLAEVLGVTQENIESGRIDMGKVEIMCKYLNLNINNSIVKGWILKRYEESLV